MGHWKGELRHMPTKSCRQVGTSCASTAPTSPSVSGAPPCRDSPAHCSGSFPATHNSREGEETFNLWRLQLPRFLGA